MRGNVDALTKAIRVFIRRSAAGLANARTHWSITLR